jgi:hypothetical protein
MEIALFSLGLFAGWLTAHVYYRKSTRDLERKLGHLQEALQEALRPRTSLADFEAMLQSSQWRAETIADANVWICERDNSFQVVQGESDLNETFTERWTEQFPDQQHSGRCPVYLKIGGTIVKEITFVHLDGGRLLVPLPEVRVENKKQIFYWRESSAEFKLGEIIGRFYRYNTMYGVASFCDVRIERDAPGMAVRAHVASDAH